MFTAYSTQGQLKPRLIVAEGFWYGLIQAAAYLGRDSVRINALKRCPRLAEAVNDCCACSVFNHIPDLPGRETRVAVAGKRVLFTFTKKKMADRDSCKKKKKFVECHRRNTNPAHMQRAWDCGDLSMKPLNGSLSNLLSGFSHKFPNFLWPISYLGTQHQSWPKRQFKMKKTVKKKQRFLRAKASRLAFLLARTTVARCKRNYPKMRHQNKLRHH